MHLFYRQISSYRTLWSKGMGESGIIKLILFLWEGERAANAITHLMPWIPRDIPQKPCIETIHNIISYLNMNQSHFLISLPTQDACWYRPSTLNPSLSHLHQVGSQVWTVINIFTSKEMPNKRVIMRKTKVNRQCTTI